MPQIDGRNFPKGEFWRSIDELESSQEFETFLENEFPEQASSELKDPVSRRRFMQVMGASFAFAGVAGACRWEEDHVIPLSRRPEGYLPGVPRYYASSTNIGGAAQPVLVTSMDGRPIKVDGNAEAGLGSGCSTFAQATVLGLYDPDRATTITAKKTKPTWGALESELQTLHDRISSTKGRGVAILTTSAASPTAARLHKSLKEAFPNLVVAEYEPISDDNEREGLRTTFGRPARLVPELKEANVALAIDCDMFGNHPAQTKLSTDFGVRRRNPETMMRLYSIESAFTATGASADHRLPLRSELAVPVLQAILAKVTGGQPPAADIFKDASIAKFVNVVSEDLLANKGKAVVVPGRHLPPAAHSLAAVINAQIGSEVKTTTTTLPSGEAVGTHSVSGPATYYELRDADRPSHMRAISSLAQQLKSNAVDTLVILGGNPAYDAPADTGFADALKNIKTIHLSQRYNETSELCDWHIPEAHYLESWGDAFTVDGRVAIQQPVIRPMYAGKTAIEILHMLFARTYPDVRELVRTTFDNAGGGNWKKALLSGIWGDQAARMSTASVVPPRIVLSQTQKRGEKLDNGQLEVVLLPSPHAFDGRFANNAWLQELPDFMSKLTWDNAAFMSKTTANSLGVSHQDMVEIEAGGNKIRAAVYVQAGHAPYSIAISLGHGRWAAGHVGGSKKHGVNPSGFNAYPLLKTATRYIIGGATVKRTGGSYKLASTQDHWDYRDSQGRKGVEARLPRLIRELEREEADQVVPAAALSQKPAKRLEQVYPDGRNPKVHEGVHVEQDVNLFDGHEYNGNKWGMSMDLSLCNGCNACIVSCQAENNIPVVGKDQVANSREMHWLRVDRYFSGQDMDKPSVHLQPMHCQQCENAPCEQVCPVGATIHSHEGLNDMVYNRCIGTRYCLNNCPYKVRRFNFLNWHKRIESLEESKNQVRALVFNPDVTVRSRGVMEKCTWCVQRIQNAKIAAKNDGKVDENGRRLIPDGTITTACQDACPTGAIVFGDLNDPDSAVSKRHADPNSYELLEDLDTRPRNKFIAKVWNHNKKLGSK